VALGKVIRQRKEFITIDDLTTYNRCRVQLHAQGIVLRDELEGARIKTKSQQICHADEFLVAEIDAKVGGFGIVPPDLEGAIVSSHYFLFVIDETKLDKRYLDYFIRTPDFQDQVNARGSTNYAAIRPHHVLTYEIPLPPLTEQRRIVARIESLAAKVETARDLRQSAVGETKHLWVSALSKAFQPENHVCCEESESATQLLQRQAQAHAKSRSPQYNRAYPEAPQIYKEGFYDIPASWVWTDLGSILTHLVDCVNDTPDFLDQPNGLLGLKSTNIRPYELDLSQQWFMTSDDFEWWNRREAPRSGDIILTREAPMGNACILPQGVRACLTQRLMLLRTDEKFVNTKYVLHFINSTCFKNQILDICRGLTTPHIRVEDAPKIKIPFSPLPEQRRIVAHLDALQAKIAAVQQHQAATQARLEALLPSILDRAFKGEL